MRFKKLLKHLFFLVCLFSTLSHGGIVFSADILFHDEIIATSSPTNPWEKAMADINGDNKLDMLIGGPTGPLIWYAYPDWTPTTIAGTGSYNSACGIATADIDNDGDVDVVMGGITWFENPGPTGNPSTDTWSAHTVGNHYSHDIVISDLDGDGLLDIISRSQNNAGNVVNIYRQLASDSWIKKSLSAVSGEGLTTGDYDSDGDVDIAIPRQWYENTGNIEDGLWPSHDIAPLFDQVAVARSSDINQDGRTDLILSGSESEGEVAWFECPSEPRTEPWIRHDLGTTMDSIHGLDVADFDGDGDMDIAASEFRGAGQLILFHNNGTGTLWQAQVLGDQQLHNIVVGDFDDDGDSDIFGAYCWNTPPAYLWVNESAPYITSIDDWTYIQIDDSRMGPDFGLIMGDGNGDGLADIAAGRYIYKNPGGDLSNTWQRTALPVNADANFIIDVDNDNYGDIIAQALPDLYWFETDDATMTSFSSRRVATGIAATGHGNSQGYTTGDIIAGGKKEIILSSGAGIYFVQIPTDPVADSWPVINITANSPEEGVAVGDIDNDGDNDVAAWIGNGSGSTQLGWWENPGNGTGNWSQYTVGNTVSEEGDRVLITDINQDGLNDIVVTETNNGISGNRLLWFECPLAPKDVSSWTRHTVAADLGAMNSLDVQDMNNDGWIDIVTGEHRGDKHVVVWENVAGGSASWIPHLVDSGKESHLGTQTADLDNDGDYDIVSICWDDYPQLHLWRNDARNSIIPGDTEPPVLTSVSTTASPKVIVVTFDEPITRESAENISHYTISDSINVSGAMLHDNEQTVTLSTETLVEDVTYTLTITDISDLHNNTLVTASRQFLFKSSNLTSGLVGYWPFNEESGTVCADVSENQHHGTLHNGTIWTEGKFGNGVSFDGQNDYVALPNLDVEGDQLSISAWFKPALLTNCGSNDCRIISKATSSSESDHYWMLSTIKVGESTRLRFRLKTGTTTTTLIANTGNLSNDTWAHAVAVYDGGQMLLYLDSQEVGSVTKSGELATNAAVQVNIGRNPDSYGVWNGIIDEVRLYDKALNNNEILLLYQGVTTMAGDINGDMSVDLQDAILSLQVVSGQQPTQQLNADADINEDGKIGLAETVFALEKVAGERLHPGE